MRAAEQNVYIVKREAEVRQSFSATSPLFHVAKVGATVKQLGPGRQVEDGEWRIPLVPRGWIDWSALGDVEDTSDSPAVAKASPSKEESAPGQLPEAAPKSLRGGKLFRVLEDCEVRAGPGRDSPLYHTAYKGRIIEQFGTIHGDRLPVLPRGWIDMKSIQALDGDDHAVEKQAVAPQNPPERPVGNSLLAMLGDDRQLARKAGEKEVKAEERTPPQNQTKDNSWDGAGSTWKRWNAEDSLVYSSWRSDGKEAATAQDASRADSSWLSYSGTASSPGGWDDSPQSSPKTGLAALQEEITAYLEKDSCENLAGRLEHAQAIRQKVNGILTELGAQGGAKVFGSFANGLITRTSDLDLTFDGTIAAHDGLSLLSELASRLSQVGFDGVTKIFQASIPLVKFRDPSCGIEVDFCVSNQLGLRNSMLLAAYCNYDPRVAKLGRLVKDWAKSHQIVGTADGCLNSYAYILMAIHYLQSAGLVPNLQILSTKTAPVWDTKWGTADRWETKFVEDVGSLPASPCHRNLAEILLGFFRYFSTSFNWHRHAVCPRLNRPSAAVDKFSLVVHTSQTGWYIEDPFDLRHNLARSCSEDGKKRILQAMRHAAETLGDPSAQEGAWIRARGSGEDGHYFLKTKIIPGVKPEALVQTFEDLELEALWFPEEGEGMLQAFFEFRTAGGRRKALTRNERYVEDCQLVLYTCSRYSLDEARASARYSSHAPQKPSRPTFKIEA